MAVALPLLALVATAASTGVAVHQSQEATRQAKDATRDQENAKLAQDAALAQKDQSAKATDMMRIARARQLALAGQQNGIASTYAPQSLGGGGATATPVGGKTQLGQ
jgi:hypothetical protein